jgi:hypothetical protein
MTETVSVEVMPKTGGRKIEFQNVETFCNFDHKIESSLFGFDHKIETGLDALEGHYFRGFSLT